MMQGKHVLIIGLVWPEPTSSAAGWRMMQLVDFFLSRGAKLSFCSAATKSEFSTDWMGREVPEYAIALNDVSFDDFIRTMAPDVVVYDRFMVEEQYGWRVRQYCPDAVTILDTEDLHFLRDARKDAHKQGVPFAVADFSLTDLAKRELASIWRCDLSLVISEFEYELLSRRLGVDKDLLVLLPFLSETIDQDAWLPYSEREHFVFIGNYLHEPNWRTAQLLKTEVWPVLRKLVPRAELHLYGAYASQKVLNLHQPKERFFVKGRAEGARTTLASYRLMLAPIPFGAGLKGKFVDAMFVGLPSVTTVVGAEGMIKDGLWPGGIALDTQELIASAVELYMEEPLWIDAQAKCAKSLINATASPDLVLTFEARLQVLFSALAAHRARNVVGQVLHFQTNNGTKYMSLWIAEKNKRQ